jgi:hypothetical protein
VIAAALPATAAIHLVIVVRPATAAARLVIVVRLATVAARLVNVARQSEFQKDVRKSSPVYREILCK